MKRLSELASKYNVHLLEDSAHALGGDYKEGGKIGNCERSLISGYSLHPVKNITTGEGGVLTTNDVEVYKQLCRIRSHGITKGNDPFALKELAFTNGKKNQWYYEMQTLGYNFRLTDIQSALGISQMTKLDCLMKKRRDLAAIYDNNLSKFPFVQILQRETRNVSGNHLYTIQIDYKKLNLSRNEVFERFSNHGVHLHVHYIPVFLQPFYRDIEGNELAMNCINTLNYYEQAATLPLHPLLTEKNLELVLKIFGEF
jgi:dTDP-4-amino-4,6-dideoxygalactose transaminase